MMAENIVNEGRSFPSIDPFRVWIYAELETYEIDLQKKILCYVSKEKFIVMTIDAIVECLCSLELNIKEAVYKKIQEFEFAENVEEFLQYTANLLAKGQL